MDVAESTCSERTCTKCHVSQPRSHYTKVGSTLIGLSAVCKACARAYYLANKERILAKVTKHYREKVQPLRRAKAEERIKARAEKAARTEKQCARCRELKSVEHFGASSNRLDGLHVYCRPCKNAESRAYAKANPEKIRASNKRISQANPEKVRERSRRWYHSGKGKEFHKAWAAANRDLLNRKSKERRQIPTNRIHHSIRSRLQATLKNKAGRRTVEILGYSMEELKRHLELQFLPGMTWDNYGEWHIDHVVALSSFVVDDVDHPDVKRAWGLPNLRPIWAKDNLRKHAKRLFLL